MNSTRHFLPAPARAFHWRHAVLIVILLGIAALLAGGPPILQDAGYHAFADTRSFAGIPNAMDVLSNLPFLVIGITGVRLCVRIDPGPARAAWTTLFIGVALVSAGSAYYHWNPDNASLVWDRLPMTLGFMGLFTALLAEYVDRRLAVVLLPALALGVASVLYWHLSSDLRLYYWVQLAPLAAIPLVMLLYRGAYTHGWLLASALGCYTLSKLAEVYDTATFAATHGVLSGHTMKHLLAALACYLLYRMLRVRRPVA